MLNFRFIVMASAITIMLAQDCSKSCSVLWPLKEKNPTVSAFESPNMWFNTLWCNLMPTRNAPFLTQAYLCTLLNNLWIIYSYTLPTFVFFSTSAYLHCKLQPFIHSLSCARLNRTISNCAPQLHYLRWPRTFMSNVLRHLFFKFMLKSFGQNRPADWDFFILSYVHFLSLLQNICFKVLIKLTNSFTLLHVFILLVRVVYNVKRLANN